MNMESPVRICIGAALVVNLLLITSTKVTANTLPIETTSTTLKNDRDPWHGKINSTFKEEKNKLKSPDTALNELNPQDSTSEENAEKNAKYKDRGRVKFNVQTKTSTVNPLKGVTKESDVIIVTPTPEVKKTAEIIDSMRHFKKTRIPAVTIISSTEPINAAIHDDDEFVEEDDEEEDMDSLEKFTSTKFDDSSFFTMPSFDDEDDDYSAQKYKYGSHKQNKHEYDTPTFSSFPDFFPKNVYSLNQEESYNSESYVDFGSELTTPKNNFFDKKFRDISSSIVNKLDTIKSKSPSPNVTTNVHKIVKENRGFEQLSNNSSPSNKSTVFIKNTKEIRILDNDKEDTSNKGLSDVHGTSIYYEMTVLSTETYNIDKDNEDDCDNDSQSSTTTLSTPLKDELASIKMPLPTLVESSTKSNVPDSEPSPSSVSKISSDFFSTSKPSLRHTSLSPISFSTQNVISSTVTPKIFSSSFSRSRNYSKRLNLSSNKDSPNSVFSTSQPEQVSSNQAYRPQTRRFHFTTPKSKPIWMVPRRNISRISYTRVPTTIYAEHFDIKDKMSSTSKPKLSSRTLLTTQSSEINPVLQNDGIEDKKVLPSQSLSDNTIPTVWKRGSVKFSPSTVSSAEKMSGLRDLEIPPTSTAWALASMRSPPSAISPIMNTTQQTQKSQDENELQDVGETLDKKIPTTMPSTTTTTTKSDFTSKNITEIDQNRLPWKPIYPTISVTETISERVPAESIISLQSSQEPPVTEPTRSIILDQSTKIFENKNSWIPVTNAHNQIMINEIQESLDEKVIPVVGITKKAGFESITKLPSEITTPTDDTNTNLDTTNTKYKIPTTTDYEITTIRFSYVPTEELSMNTAFENNTEWYPIVPTRTRSTLEEGNTITTYRPKYEPTVNSFEETTITNIDSTPQIEISSQIMDKTSPKSTSTTMNTVTITETPEITTPLSTIQTPRTTIPTIPTQITTKMIPITTELIEDTTELTTGSITTSSIIQHNITDIPVQIKTEHDTETTIPLETTTIIVTVATEINSERVPVTVYTPSDTTELVPMVKTNETSQENSSSNEVIIEESTTMPPETTTETSTKIERVVTTIEVKIPTTSPRTTTEAKRATEVERTTETERTTEVERTTKADRTTETERITKAEITTEKEHLIETTVKTTTQDVTTDVTTTIASDSKDFTNFAEDVTTEASSRILEQEAGTGAAIAIAVSTIGVIALILLVGLLLVVRRRGRRGVYAQRCTPVSLDAYSLDSVSVGHRKGNHRLRASKRSYGNPAYEDEVTSHPMQYPALANFALDIDSITAEFAEIPSVTVRPDEVPPGCEDKNRYSNVLPLPETRVPLRRIGNDPTSEYINANYITGPGNIRNYYIACQAPLHNTVIDFWRMIWEQNSRLIVMLTEYMENGVEKCYEYLPPSEITDNKRTFGEFQIILQKREQRDKYAISSIQLINLVTRTWREVTQLWFFWPAKGVPDDYDSILDFLSEMRSYMKVSQTAKEYDEEGVEVIYQDQSRSSYNNLSKLRSDENGSSNGVNVYSPAKAEEMMRKGNPNNGTLGKMKMASEIEGVRPCVIVCASGAGRSAALIAADLCARALASGQVDVPRIVRRLRDQRPHSLSNRHHYILLYKLLSEYGNRLMGGGADTI